MKNSNIYGIPCSLQNQHAKKALKKVLQQIEEKFPKDFKDLTSLIREIKPFTKDEIENDPGTLGQWFTEYADPNDPATWGYGYARTPGTMKLNECSEPDGFISTIAHELGHAATCIEDLDRRGDIISNEWRSEMTADWYAYKWGFGREIAKRRKTSDISHHGPTPGQKYSLDNDGKRYKYKVSRRFVSKLIGVENL